MDPAFDADREAVFARARAAGVAALIVVGYDLPSSRAALDIATRPSALAAVGIHPNMAAEADTGHFDTLAELARDGRVVAIGETGLDYYRQHTPPARQRAAFDWHLRLAEERGLPVIVHNRQADADVADALEASAARRPSGAVPGVLHCFSSTDPHYLERMLVAGYCVSFAGPLTFKTAADLRAMAARVPLDRLLVETDCPYLAPVPHRGQRNEPAFVGDTAACLAAVHSLAPEVLQATLWRNSVRVFPALARIPLGVG
jgi:TatD DNase family protein